MSISFCNQRHKRKGPVSSTHQSCGGDEANCACEEVAPLEAPQSEQPAAHSPCHSSDEGSDPIEVVEVPMTVEKPPPASDPGKRLLSPQREAALAIRRWSVNFFKIGLDFPSCMQSIAHKNPYEIYRLLKLDECASRRSSIDWKLKGHAKMQEGAIRNCALTASVKYEKMAPPCFNPFSINEYAPNLEEFETEALDKEQIWWLLDKSKNGVTDGRSASAPRKKVNLHKAQGRRRLVSVLHHDHSRRQQCDQREHALQREETKIV